MRPANNAAMTIRTTKVDALSLTALGFFLAYVAVSLFV
jgi:hypothetical protein